MEQLVPDIETFNYLNGRLPFIEHAQGFGFESLRGRPCGRTYEGEGLVCWDLP